MDVTIDDDGGGGDDDDSRWSCNGDDYKYNQTVYVFHSSRQQEELLDQDELERAKKRHEARSVVRTYVAVRLVWRYILHVPTDLLHA